MTLSSTNTKATYNGDGSTTAFAVSFIFWNNSDLRVIHRDSAGVETVWVEATQYTLTGGSGATGTLTVKTTPTDYTPASGETLTIKDYQSEVQGDSLPLSGAFPSTVVEQRLDKMTRLIQIHSEEIARAILLPETASLSGLQIPEPGAGELVRYNAAGTNLETVALTQISLMTVMTGLAAEDFLKYDGTNWINTPSGATGRSLLAAASAAAALTTLGLTANGQSLVTAANYAAMRALMGLVIGTNVQAYDADTAKLDVAQAWTAAQRAEVTALADGASIAVDLALSNDFSVTLGGNRTLANPTNAVAGQSGVITVTQDATGTRTLAYGANYKFAGGTAVVLSTAANNIDELYYRVKSSTEIHVSAVLGWS